MVRAIAVAGLCLLLASCSSTDTMSPSPMASGMAPGGPSVIASAPPVAGPPGCAGPISEYQQVIDNDAETGHLNPGVYNRVRSDLEPVKQACAAGREKDATTQLAAVKRRYGYR